MNKQIKRRLLLQSIKTDSRKESYCKYYPNNSDAHEDVKWFILKKFKKRKYLVYTEGVLSTGGRFDIALISPEGIGTIVEVMNSEKEKNFNDKLNKYDLLWNIISVSVKDFDIDEFEL